jgi:hypothetical protein
LNIKIGDKMINFDYIKQKIPGVFVIIGLILTLFHSLEAFKQFLFFSQLSSISKSIDNLFFQGFFDSIITNFIVSNFGILTSSIIGLVLSILLIFYSIRIMQTPNRKDFIAVTVIGALGIFLSSAIGGVLILIAGIMGWRKYS